MLIEFCCPVCRAPLSVDEKVAGGQVNCPKCQKLILIPMRSPLARQGDKEPFAPGLQHASEDVQKAIATSVEPYRLELDSKVKLLNDAVEMVKVRNQRIRDVETLMLGIQKEFWELEVEYDERNEAWKRAQSERRELRKKLKEQEGDTQAGTSPGVEDEAQKEQREQESRQLEEYRRRVEELEEKARKTHQQLEVLTAEAEDAKGQLGLAQTNASKLEDSLAERNEQLSEATSHLGVLGVLTEFTGRMNEDYQRQENLVEARNQVFDTAREMLEKSADLLDKGETRLTQLKLAHQEAIRERDSWKEQTEKLRKSSEERDQRLQDLQKRLEDQTSLFESAKGSTEEQESVIASLQEKLNQAQQEVLEREKRLQEVHESAQNQLDKSMALEQQKAEVQAMLQAETQRADTAQRKVESLQKTMEETQRALETSQVSAKDELDELRKKLIAASREEANAREHASILEKELQSVRKRLASQPDELETLSGRAAGNQDQIQVLLRTTQEELGELRSEHRALEDKYKAMQNRQAHDKTLTERLMKLETENRDLMKTRLELESELGEAQRQAEKLSLQIEASSVQGGSGGESAESSGASVTDLLRTLKEKEARIEGFDDEKYGLERQIKELNNENKRLQNTVKTLSANLKAQWKRGSTATR